MHMYLLPLYNKFQPQDPSALYLDITKNDNKFNRYNNGG